MSVPAPTIPQTVIRFFGQPTPRIPATAADTVALVLSHDWGPVGSDPPGSSGIDGGIQELLSFDDWIALFGDSDTDGRTAVAGTFAGEGLPGASGAGTVLAYRVAGSGAAKSTATLLDRTGADALTLDGKYVGSRGDSISYIVDSDPADATRDRLRLLFKGTVTETYTFAQTDIATLEAQINLNSSLVAADNLESAPARLAAVASPGTALSGGNDGISSLLSTDHDAARSALERKGGFGVVSVANLTSGSILASYIAWVQQRDQANYPVRFVCGGAAGETYATAKLRTQAAADPHVVNLGVGTWHDDLLDADLSTAQLAPRIAGILAARGEAGSITAALLGGIHPVGNTAPSKEDIDASVTEGVVTIMPASSPDAELRIAKGVTTFTDATDQQRPVDVFSDARLIGIMDNYVREMKTWGDTKIIGRIPVGQDARDAVYAKARNLQDALVHRGLVLPGDGVLIPFPWVVVRDTDADPAFRDAVPYSFGWQFARTTNSIIGEGAIS